MLLPHNNSGIEPDDQAVEAAAIELEQHRKELLGVETELRIAESHLEAANSQGHVLTVQAALEMVRINRETKRNS